MAKDASSKMRRTILASALGGIIAVSACIAVTGATVEGMKANAVTAMAQRAEQGAQAPDGTQQPSSQPSSQSASQQGGADGSQGQPSSSAASDVGPSSDGGSSQGHGGDGSASSGGASGTSEGTGDGGSSPSTGVEIVGKGSYNGAEVYLVRWGDTLSYISAETGISVDALAHYNGIDDVDLIYADSAIQIPNSPDGKS